LGCVLSHIEVIEKAKAQNLPYVLIFEDDVTFPLNFDYEFQKCLNELPEDWDLFYLSGTPKTTPQPISEHVCKCGGMWGTFGYMVRESVYDFILLELNRQRLTADSALIKIAGLMNVYIAKNKLISHAAGFSYIAQKEREVKWLI
jgi:GR25 family glycosyltransferase involved in LPS biosynthesis